MRLMLGPTPEPSAKLRVNAESKGKVTALVSAKAKLRFIA